MRILNFNGFINEFKSPMDYVTTLDGLKKLLGPDTVSELDSDNEVKELFDEGGKIFVGKDYATCYNKEGTTDNRFAKIEHEISKLMFDTNEGLRLDFFAGDAKQELLDKAKQSGLMDIENDDLTAEGIKAKMIEWDKSENGVPANIYDNAVSRLNDFDEVMPESVRRKG